MISLFCTACVDDEPDQPIEEIPNLKEQILLDDGNARMIEDPLIYNDLIIVMITNIDNSEGWINCYDKNTLELKWRWQEAMDTYGNGARGFSGQSYLHEGVLCIAHVNLSYGIDVYTGETLWHNRENSGTATISGNEDRIASMYYADWKNDINFRIANVSDGQWETVFTLLKEDQYFVAGTTPKLFSWEGKEYATFTTIKWGTAPHYEESWLHLYNITDATLEWTSDTIPKSHNLSPIPSVPLFEDGQILLCSNQVYSYNFEDGSLEWRKDYGNYFTGPSDPIVQNGNFYANNHTGFLISLDVHTGEEKFNVATGGSQGNLFYNDDKVYFSGAIAVGIPELYVVDAFSGEILHQISSPYRTSEPENSGWYFQDVIGVDPETDDVYVSDHKYLLVYDFE